MTFDVKFLCRGLFAVFGILLLASLLAQTQLVDENHRYIIRLANLFYFGGENNFPTAFSSFLLLFSAGLFLLFGRLEYREQGYWNLLGFIFACLAMDEAFEFHESLTSPMQKLLGPGDLGIFHYAWVIPGALAVLLLASVLFRFWWRQERLRWSLLLAAVVFLSGALGVEALGGRYMEQHGAMDHSYRLMTQVEESLEMLGVLLLIRTLLSHLAKYHGTLTLQLICSGKSEGAELFR
ncbi:hypothetical protein GCM10025772_20740 [Ferrimonas gelatinilytica]|uniref:Multidrug transporter n=2 Tax=Ferrimonas gelatinilytica TaxID=1255257 RepID=A0ABP9S962_9GAMM